MIVDGKIEAAATAAGIAVRALFDGARFELPARPARPGLGAAIAIGGLVMASFMAAWISFPWIGAARMHGPGRWVLFAFGLVGVPGLIAGLMITIAGISLSKGLTKTVVEVSGGRLAVTERFGSFHWTWRRPLASIDRIVLGASAPPEGGAARTASGPPMPFLQAAGPGLRKPLVMAAMYPLAILEPLACAVSAVSGQPLATESAAIRGSRAAGAGGSDYDSSRETGTIAPPPGTHVRFLKTAEGMAVDVPPRGLVKGSQGLFVFAVVWLVFCGLVFAPMAIGFAGRKTAPWPLLLAAGLFMAIGALMLGVSIHMGRRRSMIAIGGATIGLRQIGPFGRSERRFARTDVADIRVDPSGLKVNDRPVMHLVWELRDGRTIGCLSQLSEPELHWLAAELRRYVVGPTSSA